MLLAQSFYKQPGLAEKILGGYQNQQQIFAEPSLLTRLEAGQIDAYRRTDRAADEAGGDQQAGEMRLVEIEHVAPVPFADF